MILIFVESPSKAKAINEYLKGMDSDYQVLATVGHVRNLSKSSGSIDVKNDFEYVWDYTLQWNKNKKQILSQAKKADEIIIASDPDREGEAIAWHLNEIFEQNKIKCPIKRIVFHSISKQSILKSLKNKIDIRKGLVNAYLARVGLDYLFGYSISPLLWRKIPCCKSAGRVQSAGLKLIVEKEYEILKFIKRKYITIYAQFNELANDALLTIFNEQKFENGNIFEEDLINIEDLKDCKFKIDKVIKTQQKQNPPAPLITSKLQQLASSILNFNPTTTMQLAQKLYEGFSINGKHTGLITYMRTDSFHIEKDAIIQIREKIKSKYGKEFLSKDLLTYSKSVKNAQEAHEAIRPIDINLEPDSIMFLDENLKKLYNLIWTRTIVTQCAQALLDKTNVKIVTKDHNNNDYLFELNDTFVVFPSFKKIIQSEEEDEIKHIDLSKVQEGKELGLKDLFKKDHETQPPKRYSEATFINQLEKLGIGRPSTYANVSSILFEREYIERNKKIISPTSKGWIVTSFLESFFKREISYDFTSEMEESLDIVASKNEDFKIMLHKFWDHLDSLIKAAESKGIDLVCKEVEKVYPEFFNINNDKCKCGGDLILKVTKFGVIRGCLNYPNCNFIVQINNIEKKTNEYIGLTDNNEKIFYKKGPYGAYLEIEQESLKRVAIPKFLIKNDEITLENALKLISLPKQIGLHNDSMIILNTGRYGPYLQWNKTLVSINCLDMDLELAVKKIEQKIKSNEKNAK